MILFVCTIPCFANNQPVPTLQLSQQKYLPEYFNFYIIDYDNLKANLVYKNRDDIKKLDKYSRKQYKFLLNIEKKMSQNKYSDVYKKIANRPFLPYWYNLYHYYSDKNDYKNSIICLNNISLFYKQFGFNKDNGKMFSINWEYALKYYFNNDYKNAIPYIQIVLKEYDNSFFRTMLVDSYYQIKNYKECIVQANLIKKDDIDNSKIALDRKYLAFFNLKDYKSANKIAYELYSYSYPDKYTSNMRIATTSNGNDTKLKYYEEAKKYTSKKEQLWITNSLIYSIDKIKIDNKIKTTKGYIEAPYWDDIIKDVTSLMSLDFENERFDKYHKTVNNCLKYTGNDLKACFNNIKQEQEKINVKLVEQQREYEHKLAEYERIRQLQMLNVNLMEANYLQQQQNYILNRPRYTNTTITPIGNTYYMNTYSY